jgi:hypothetical protein
MKARRRCSILRQEAHAHEPLKGRENWSGLWRSSRPTPWRPPIGVDLTRFSESAPPGRRRRLVKMAAAISCGRDPAALHVAEPPRVTCLGKFGQVRRSPWI